MLTEIFFILLLVLINGLFAMAEMALVSARKTRLQDRATSGDEGSRMALDLVSRPTRFLSTVQVGITLIGILAGALGGAAISRPLATWLARFPGLAPYSQSIALAIVVLVITYFSLVLGELVPKRIALSNPERIAAALARPMRLFAALVSPVARLLSLSTDLVVRTLGIRPSKEPPVTEEEIRLLLEQGTEAGIFEEEEEELVRRVLLLDERRAAGLMTPRRDVVWLDIDDSPEELRAKILASPYSRFPVAKESLDNVLGEVQAKDLLAQSLSGQPLDLRPLIRKPLYVAEVMPALKVLGAFKQSETEMALVIDEYGNIQGLVTLIDILEAIVGDIPSATEEEEPKAVRREDGTWLVDGLLPVDEFKELFGIEELPGEEQGFYQTVAGFLVMQLGRIPTVAERLEWGGITFEVMDMDGPRVDKVLVTLAAEREQEDQETLSGENT
ncbi:MAG: HlyC/CorC family transporter [Chloroflexi bacterium]|nr:HlyC/CorC family transporter [Chloroflexota bacterium]